MNLLQRILRRVCQSHQDEDAPQKLSSVRINMDNYRRLLAALSKRPKVDYGIEGSTYLHQVGPYSDAVGVMGRILKADAPIESGPAMGQVIPHLRPSSHGAHGKGVYTWNDRPRNVYFNPYYQGAKNEGFVFDRPSIGDSFGRKRARPPLSGEDGLDYKSMTLFDEPLLFNRGDRDFVVLSPHGNLNSREAAEFVERTGITPVTSEQFHSALQNAHWKTRVDARLRMGDDLDDALERVVEEGLRPRLPGSMKFDDRVIKHRYGDEVLDSGRTVREIAEDVGFTLKDNPAGFDT